MCVCVGIFVYRKISKVQKAQEVESVETEERLLNKNFMENKYQEITSRVRSAEVFTTFIIFSLLHLHAYRMD